jgi:hypothetical protein
MPKKDPTTVKGMEIRNQSAMMASIVPIGKTEVNPDCDCVPRTILTERNSSRRSGANEEEVQEKEGTE